MGPGPPKTKHLPCSLCSDPDTPVAHSQFIGNLSELQFTLPLTQQNFILKPPSISFISNF